MGIIILIGIIIVAVLVILKIVRSYKIKREVVIFFSGTMGSGKTLLAVRQTLSNYAYQYWHTLIHNIFHPKHKEDMPVIYSNIPIKHKRYIPLTVEMLKKDELMKQNCCILIDEFGGSIANQFDWSDPSVSEHLTAFIRFARHWLNCLIVITDQTADSIPKPVRQRISGEYHLARFRKKFHFCYMIDIYPVVHISEDVQNVMSTTNNDDEEIQYIFGFFGFFKRYASRCYCETYRKGFVYDKAEDVVENPLHTRLMLDITSDKETVEKFKKDKHKAKIDIYKKVL